MLIKIIETIVITIERNNVKQISANWSEKKSSLTSRNLDNRWMIGNLSSIKLELSLSREFSASFFNRMLNCFFVGVHGSEHNLTFLSRNLVF